MKIFEKLCLKFEEPLWAIASEFAVMDVILEKHPEIIKSVEADVTAGLKNNGMGRGDTPSVEQITRMAIFKELKNLEYRELEFAQSDSKLCEHFCKTDALNPFSFQMWQKYISRIKKETYFYHGDHHAMLEDGRKLNDEGYAQQGNTGITSNVLAHRIHDDTKASLYSLGCIIGIKEEANNTASLVATLRSWGVNDEQYIFTKVTTYKR